MKIPPLLALTTTLTCSAATFGADSSGAVLRCDPGTVIEKIDGSDKASYKADYGSSFKECAIPLSPGAHVLLVCYDASVIAYPYSIISTCPEKREVRLDAQAGHTYRLKIHFAREWQALVEDVSESEAGISYAPRAEKPKPKGSKKDRETFLVLRATPTRAVLGVQKGWMEGKWFGRGQYGGLTPLKLSNKGVPDGYHVFHAYQGDTVAMNSLQLMDGILHQRSAVACGDFPMRVYEDLPAGKVLYLGHFTISEAPPNGYVTAYRDDDLAEARAYIDAHFPELAGRLEATTTFREARSTNICRTEGHDLTGTPDGLWN